MTLPAGLLSDFKASWRDVNVVIKPAGREIVRMPEPVARFSGILGDKPGRRMAIITDSNCSMARLHPTAKLVLHDMAVHTCFRVVSHVRIATSVDEGVGANSDRQSDCNSQNYARH